MRTAPMTSQGSEFQQFLYAPICEEHEGMTLSVLSALARQDIDPWTEAARLSQLPEETAVEQIIALLDALPRRIVASLDRMKVASRLSALLPRRAASNLPSVRPAAGGQRLAAFASNWRLFYLYFCLMLLMNWLIAEFRAPPSAVAGSDTRTGTATIAPDTNSPSNYPGKTLNSNH
jgi:hypothetical protein